ncbi:transcription-repair coupling factor [Sphingorhabdus lutea]|uniref:Transcription-repair-coupling factor n=1 Tax=Sphingorhabdus lutea TaxID=1913578 RepID=A0A1L3JC82_9SPHN|nr:transcription-repair coupling factor [Sphingorhabdus lutea]APG62757.1 transcription-repair coupling factor [Sphingorhabdus lutea]
MDKLQKLITANAPHILSGVASGFAPYLLADLARLSKGRLLYIASSDQQMSNIADSINYFAPEIEVLEFPAWDCLPYDRAPPSANIMARRMAFLNAIQQQKHIKQILLTTVNAATQRTLSPFRMRQIGVILTKSMKISMERVGEILRANGYIRVDTVADKGEYAIRGSLLDMAPSDREDGYRIDFFGDQIESIRSFDFASQRSTGDVKEFSLLPAVETFLDDPSIKRFRTAYRNLFGGAAINDPLYSAISEGRRFAGMEHWLPLFEDKMVSIFDHLNENDMVVSETANAQIMVERHATIADYYDNRKKLQTDKSNSYRPISPEMLYLDEREISSIFQKWPVHIIDQFDRPDQDNIINLSIKSAHDFAPDRANKNNIYRAATSYIEKWRHDGKNTIIACYTNGSRNRLAELFQEQGAKKIVLADGWQETLSYIAKDKLVFTTLPIDHGFETSDYILLSEQDLLGDRLIRKKRARKNADSFLEELAALNSGDLVVHEEHGLGRYEGLISIPVGKSPHDCVCLTYAGGDKLYVPVENIDVLSRYGNNADLMPLDRLGGEAWQRRKAKLKQRIREIAYELIRTAAQRELEKGIEISHDTPAMNDFITRFPYQETEDQENAIEDVLRDLSSGRPMDRLVCGDVGFGKTEVAMRAAFAVAMAGYQVAIIAPTTLLARQHYTNFVERFRDFPMKIGRLSRLVPAAEAIATREGLKSGDIDIVIGTHAVISKSVGFENLGLVIVDEEQRFGVVHKEKLKAMRAKVHMLTLTATPIPRTLQMAMTGLRELSVIQTPPVDRLAVRTFVMQWDPVILREALLREHYRGGQSFMVVPRISDLEQMEQFLREYVPEIKFVTAHGQMSPNEVEERMTAFYDNRYDVLLATTIIESGLDIPSANTMIIHRADKFGLAQLYQLRGRVGRSNNRAYAYLTTKSDQIINETAEKRLKILSDLDSLGAGFQLASHDLDLRGAGNLVGDEQSGHIKEVGFELYQSMLEDAILEIKAEGAGLDRPKDKFTPQITVDAPILITEDYIPDLNIRMALYRRINSLRDREEINAFIAEMSDRFGKMPQPMANLLTLMEIKQNAVKAHLSKIEVGARGTLVSFHNDMPPNIPGLIGYIDRLNGIAKLRPDKKLVINRVWDDPVSRLNGCLQLSKGLAKIAR